MYPVKDSGERGSPRTASGGLNLSKVGRPKVGRAYLDASVGMRLSLAADSVWTHCTAVQYIAVQYLGSCQ